MPYKHLFGHQQHDVELLILAAEECNDEVAWALPHDHLDVIFRLRCDSYGGGGLSDIT